MVVLEDCNEEVREQVEGREYLNVTWGFRKAGPVLEWVLMWEGGRAYKVWCSMSVLSVKSAMIWTQLPPRKTIFVCYLLENPVFAPSQDFPFCLSKLVFLTIRKTNRSSSISFSFCHSLCCHHALQSRHVRRTSGDLSEHWKRRQCQWSCSLPLSFSLFSFHPSMSFPACSFLSSLPSIPRTLILLYILIIGRKKGDR